MIKIEDIVLEYEIPNWEFRKPQLLKTVADNKGMKVEEPGESRISSTNFFYNNPFPYDNHMQSTISELFQLYNDKGYICQFYGHAWHQVYEEGDYHGWHTHAKTNMSSVINIQCQEGQGTIFKIGEEEYQYPSREGTIIAFPGALLHRTLPHESTEPRIIVSFNWDHLGKKP